MSREQLKSLARPFPQKYIKKPAPGKYGTYVDHEIVTQALLFILGPFSFQVEQVFYNPDGILDGCTAALTCTIDGREVTITEAGDCENPTNSKTQGDRLKKAASDALKRCAMRIGCGIHLWAGTDGDFFLFESLSKEDLHAIQQDAEGPATAGGTKAAVDAAATAEEPSPSVARATASATSPSGSESPQDAANGPESSSPSVTSGQPSKFKASQAARNKLKSRAAALVADGVDIGDVRQAWQLPPIDNCDWKQLDIWAEMLTDEEKKLAAPFVKADA